MGEREPGVDVDVDVEVVRGSGWVPVQMRRKAPHRFDRRRRDQFLKVLAATCNVGFAVRAANVSYSTAYKTRRTDPAFAAEWQVAIAAGYERLEAALISRALGTDGADLSRLDFSNPEAILPEAGIDTELAMKLLTRHRATAEGRPRVIPRRAVTAAETNAALTKQLELLRRRIERSGGAMLIEHAPGGGEAK